MRVLKRNGQYENVSFDKVINRISLMCDMEPKLTDVDPVEVAQKVCSQIYDGVKTSELDELAAEICTQRSVEKLSYGTLASRIIISNNHKLTSPSFSETMTQIVEANPNLIATQLYDFVMENKQKLNSYIDYTRDYLYDYFGYKTLEKSYLIKVAGKCVERIQHMMMRVSIGLHCGDLRLCLETYDLMSQKYFIHATPTLFHAGTKHPQLLSCFLLGVEDSITGIYKAIADCAQISKWAGGIGVHIHDVRGDNALIRATNGRSTGIMPMLRVFNDVARHVNQCFTPDTWVYGERGAIQMKDCQVGDRLYTIDGSLKPILQVAINQVDKEILSIQTRVVRQPIRVTKEHQVYARLHGKAAEYISASELTTGHMVSYPVSCSELIRKIESSGEYDAKDGLYWIPIEKIETVSYTGDVYDFNMMDNHNYLTDMGIVHNSGKRNGSFAMYLEPHHCDIMSFLEAKKNHGDENSRARDLFYAVWLSDLFMERVQSNAQWSLMCPDTCRGLSEAYGDEYKRLYESYEADPKKVIKRVPARDIWREILRSQMETGTPYICYKDAANRKSNQQNLGTIKSSNLCVAPETKILTDKGHIEIQTLKDQTVNVWNGAEWSEVIVRQTGENQELMKVEFSDGSELVCTPYHKFYIQRGYYKSKTNFDIVEAKNLQPGYSLIKCEFPIINGSLELEAAYTNGFFSGDGTYTNCGLEEQPCKFKSLPNKSYCKRHINIQVSGDVSEYCKGISYTKKPHITLYHGKIDLLQHLDYISTGKIHNKKLNVTLNETKIKDKFFVPIDGYSIKSKLEWLEGIADADGSVTSVSGSHGISVTLSISSIHYEFLKNIKYMLQTCGINPKISKMRDSDYHNLPDSNRNMRLYKCNTIWRLLISTYDLQILISLGFSPKRHIIDKMDVQREAGRFIKVVNVSKLERRDNTYCFNEPKRHMGIFNGVIAGNCSEIIEYSDHKEYACCTLASIALPSYIEEFDTKKIESVQIYSKTDCKFCSYSKRLLESKGIAYEEINLDDPDKRSDFFIELNKSSGAVECTEDGCQVVGKAFKTVPQIFINGKHIGGFAELYSYFKPTFNFRKLYDVVKVATQNLNKVIDLNYYPVPETALSNFRHRPLGIGVQGLADVYARFRVSFDSLEAAELNKQIFATIYYAACDKSNEMAVSFKEIVEKSVLNRESLDMNNECVPIHPKNRQRCFNSSPLTGAYSTFEGSPMSQGKFQFDLWGCKPLEVVGEGTAHEVRFDWDGLRTRIMKYGMRNSLLLAPMPTASTSQILGNNECIEPFTSNLYSRGTLAGQFVVLNKYLMNDLQAIGLWDSDLKDMMILHNGSIQKMTGIPEVIRNTYKVAWDLSMKALIDQSADRGVYIFQTQSLNLWLEDPDFSKLSTMHFYSWKKGLKTGIYYLRRRAVSKAQTFSIDASKTKTTSKNDESECLMCSS
jgi:ribonucleotide reductase alpha subunit